MKVLSQGALRARLPAIIWGVLIFIGSSIPSSKLPKFALQLNDKLVHVSIFFVFGLLIYRALQPDNNRAAFSWKRAAISVIAVIVYGVLDEFHQRFVPGRTPDVLDASADAIGGLISAAVLYVNSKRRRTTPRGEFS